MMSRTIILKLGGSIITNKHCDGQRMQKDIVLRIAKEISRFLNKNPHHKLIILHGGGSFSHPLAYRYHLVDQLITRSRLIGMGKTVNAVKTLATLLAGVFLDVGLPIVPFQTSTLCKKQKGRLVLGDMATIKTVLKHGGIPLLGGDVVLDDNCRTSIASADALAVALAKHFSGAKLLFATDVDGVYEKFPPSHQAVPFTTITRTQLQELVSKSKGKVLPSDVTGGMMGKLKALLSIRDHTVVIFNGKKPDLLLSVLQEDVCGTIVRV